MRLLLLAGLCSAVAASAVAGQDAPKERRPERLFRSREPLVLTLRGPLHEVFKDRDTMSTKSWPATIELTDDNKGSLSLPIKLKTRGHFRLKPGTCSVVPLKLEFSKESVKGTEFNDQKSLKLVTHCQNDDRFEQNLLIEESVYRMYNALTPLSHRTRLAKIRYSPTHDSTKAMTRFGFFIEDDEDMAKRNGGSVIMQTGGSFSDMDPAQMDLVAMFEYMVGNTDWSVFAIHNIRVVDVGMSGNGSYFPVAYDFDFSGLVGAHYAAPDQRLPIKSVRTRLYRGPCRKVEELFPTIERFSGARDSIYAVLTTSPALDANRVKQATSYLDGFFKEIAKPKSFDGALAYACQGR